MLVIYLKWPEQIHIVLHCIGVDLSFAHAQQVQFILDNKSITEQTVLPKDFVKII